MPLIQSVHFTFAPKDAERVVEIFKELRSLSRAEPGVVSFEVARSQDKPNVFALWEVYRDDAALRAHTESEHFQRLVVGLIRPLAKERLGEIVFPLD